MSACEQETEQARKDGASKSHGAQGRHYGNVSMLFWLQPLAVCATRCGEHVLNKMLRQPWAVLISVIITANAVEAMTRLNQGFIGHGANGLAVA